MSRIFGQCCQGGGGYWWGRFGRLITDFPCFFCSMLLIVFFGAFYGVRENI